MAEELIISARGIARAVEPVRSVLGFFNAKELEKMARREYQDPPLKKTAGQNARWYIRIRKRIVTGDGIKRKQVREYLGFCKDMKIRDAQRARTAKLAEINGQIYSVPSHILLRELVLIYNEKHVPTLGKGTQEKYRIHITNHIIPEFGNYKLLDITTERIQGFLNKKQKQGLSWWTRNDLRNILSGLFTKARDFGYWKEANPAERTTCGRREHVREMKILTDSQVVALLAELPVFLQLIIRLADCTGMRISEILGLRWESVDLAQGWLRIKERYSRGDLAQPKSDRSNRDVPVGDLIEEFRTLHSKSGSPVLGFVFCDAQGRPYDDRNLNQHYLRKTAKRLGIYFVGLGFHSFRRGQITGVQELGASSIEAAKMAGHSRPSMTFEYTHMERRRQQELVKGRQDRLKTGSASESEPKKLEIA